MASSAPNAVFGPAWSILYFLIACVIWLAVSAWKWSKLAAWIMLPYALWLIYASSLKAGIIVLN